MSKNVGKTQDRTSLIANSAFSQQQRYKHHRSIDVVQLHTSLNISRFHNIDGSSPQPDSSIGVNGLLFYNDRPIFSIEY